MKKTLLYLLGAILFITAVGLLSTRSGINLKNKDVVKQTTPTATPELKEISVMGELILVEVADTEEKRKIGLSSKENLKENEGMLFSFKENSRPSFWMKDMNFAIDMVWINDEKIVGIEKNVEPQPGVPDSELKLYPAPEPIDYVLEVSAGYADKNNLEVGGSVNLSNI